MSAVDGETKHPQPSPIERAAVLLAALALAPGAVRALWVAFRALPLPYSTLRIEAFVLDGAMRVAGGIPLYTPVSANPALVHVYNPLTYVVPGLAARIVGTAPETILVVGRCLSIASTLLLCALLSGWAWRRERSVALAALAGMSPLFFHEMVLTHFFRLRPESPALLCVASAILVASSAKTARAFVWAGSLAALAFGFKQSFVAAPVAILLHLVSTREFRLARWFAFAFCSGVALVLAASVATWGPAFIDNTVSAMAGNPVHPLTALTVYAAHFLRWAPGLLAAAFIAFGFCAFAKPGAGLFAWYFGTALLWNVYSSGKAGSSSNYFAELGLSAVLLVVAAVGSVRRAMPSAAATVILMVPLIADGAAAAVSGYDRVPSVSRDDPGVDLTPYLERYRTAERKLVTKEKLAIQLGSPEGFDWFLLDLLVASGRADLQAWLQRIAEHQYDTIVLSARATSTAETTFYRAAVAQGYEVVRADAVVVELRRRS